MLRLVFKMLCHLILEGIGVSSLLQACSAHSWEGAENPGGGEGIQLGILLDMSFWTCISFFSPKKGKHLSSGAHCK